MKIGFDLDRVFINYPPFLPVTIINKLYKLKENGEPTYRIPGKIEQKIRVLSHNSFFRPRINKNIEILKSLDHKENKLYLISSRFGFLKGRTDTIMRKYDLNKYFDGIYFNYTNEQPHRFKKEIINTLSLDMYIDDDLSILRFIAKHDKKIKLYWLNYEYSKKIENNILAIKNLSEMLPSAHD